MSLKPATQANEFYLLDALNSPIALVRGDGTLTARYSYDVWGTSGRTPGAAATRSALPGMSMTKTPG